MLITEVRIHKIELEGRIRAFASVTFDHAFVVHDIRIVQGDNGLFVTMPHRRLADGRRRDVAHPLTSDFRHTIEERVLEEFRKLTEESSPPG